MKIRSMIANAVIVTAPISFSQTKQIELVKHLTTQNQILIGTGGVDAHKAEISPQIHYQYLCCGYGQGGWRGWNQPDGEYAKMVIRTAKSIGAIPMFTYYRMAFEFEQKNFGILTSANMAQYLLDIKMMAQKIAEVDTPALVHFEPDWTGYMQRMVREGGKPLTAIPARIRHPGLPECNGHGEHLAGVMGCMIDIVRKNAPKARIGFHASSWADWWPGDASEATIKEKAASVANFLKSCGSDKTDFVVVETSDRDAGFLEATQNAKGAYWTQRDFDNHMIWARQISQVSGKPLLWWQMPFGVPSDKPGGSDYAYRDNRVQFFFTNIQRVKEAGGFAIVFGAGADKQTSPTTDGGQFKRYLDQYLMYPAKF
jgi:hypothetical protein